MCESEQKLNYVWFRIKGKKMKMRSKQKGQALTILILLKIVFVLSVLLFSELAQAASCYQYGYNNVHPDTGRIYQVYYDDGLPVDGCTHSVVITGLEYARFQILEKQNGDVEQITALSIAESFTWGFGTFIGFWFMGYAIKNARMVIRKA